MNASGKYEGPRRNCILRCWVISRPFERVNQNFQVAKTCSGLVYITVQSLCVYHSAERIYSHVQGIRDIVWNLWIMDLRGGRERERAYKDDHSAKWVGESRRLPGRNCEPKALKRPHPWLWLVAYRGGVWGFNPLSPRNSEILTKLSRNT
jgi:hypothetical protein